MWALIYFGSLWFYCPFQWWVNCIFRDFKNMKMMPGDHMMKVYKSRKSHKIHAAYRMSELQLKRRKIIRHCRKKKHYKNLDKEEPNHQYGGFWEWVNICFTYLMFCFIYMYYFLYSNRFNTNNKRHFLSNGNREEL